ncbi:MAG: TVP38/TMEM64 family protein [Deltaproteobacteria bacterium]|nr:TVP38/TMEM64 family protein [Deltaproteobacteria bacterium]
MPENGSLLHHQESSTGLTEPAKARKTIRFRILIGLLIVVLLVVVSFLLSRMGIFESICQGEELADCLARFGIFGPLLVMGLMAGAIVLSPIPGAPIAMASGAAFGHFWGTIYVLIGAETGALIAFITARLLGFEIIQKWVKNHPFLDFSSSQNTLTVIVFAARLVPFISFDLVSYAAGLSPLGFWRFALATLAGMAPASFLLAHFGEEMATGSGRRILYSLMGLSLLALIPFAGRMIFSRFRKKVPKNPKEFTAS